MIQLTTQKTVRFSPNLGALEYRLLDLSTSILDSESLDATLRRFVGTDILPPATRYSTLDELRWALALSLLSDLVQAGARVESRDSCLHVTWPDWKSSESRSRLREALSSLREESTSLSKHALDPVAIAALPGDLSREVIATLLTEGTFALREASTVFSGQLTYRDIFRAGIRSWSMPHRDREGRRVQFVLTVEHRLLGRPLPFGLIEAGDGPPFLTLRDSRLGLTRKSFLSWLGNPSERVAELQVLKSRLEAFLGALRLSQGHRRGDLQRTLRNIGALNRLAAGRSKDQTHLRDAKKAVYLARLSRALAAVNALLAARPIDETDVYALIRVIRDVSLPRLNVELSVCGALPPFSHALGGKLVAGFAADPRILAICERPPGPILQQIFFPDRLSGLLPDRGAILVTTQGLYAEHSAQYTGVTYPSNQLRATKLEKLGTTLGVTTSLISRRTDRLASELAEALGEVVTVSRVYGSGGSKRQRRLEDAMRFIGLRPEIMHPGIQRPVYGVELASNLREIALLNAAPTWSIPRTESASDYAQRAVAHWRSRWLATAERRLARDNPDGSYAGVRGLLAG